MPEKNQSTDGGVVYRLYYLYKKAYKGLKSWNELKGEKLES